MEKRDRTRGVERVSIETTQDVIVRTMETLVPKERGIQGFVIAAKLAVELGTAMKQDGKVLK